MCNSFEKRIRERKSKKGNIEYTTYLMAPLTGFYRQRPDIERISKVSFVSQLTNVLRFIQEDMRKVG